MANIKGPNGKIALVDEEGRLLSFAVSEPEDKYINREGGVHSAYFAVTPAGANDYFFYIKNEGVSELFISDIRIKSSVPSTIYYESVSGTPVFTAESPISPTNRNLGSPKALKATISSDANITGLSSDGVVFFEGIATANTRYKLSTTSNIIIPQGKAVAFRATVAGDIECVVSVIDGIS